VADPDLDLDRWMERPLSRRELLRGAGRGGLGLSLASLLAACSSGSSSAPPPSSAKLPPLAGELSVAQWPLYIDRAHGTFPTLEAFEKASGVKVDYEDIIPDNALFFAKLVPQFQRGQDTGWDLIALSDWVVSLMQQARWIERLHWDHLPHVSKNLLPAFRDPNYDPNNAHSVPWQGGTTGIAYNPKLTGFEVRRFADLWDQRLAGHVGMLTEMVDSMSLTLLMLGIEPETATLDDARTAQEKLLQQREAGLVRGYYGQDYIDQIVQGNTWASMAWSGDVFYYKELGGAPDLEFVIPEEGGVIWVTPLEIPILAQHPTDAHAFMDWYYRPDIAVQVTDWVLYMTPVAGVQELMAEKAANAKDAGTKTYYEALSTSPLLFPPKDPAEANLHEYKAMDEAEYQQWAEIFAKVTNA
jgi:spermidine/putrescine transport system substrate-binding protein